MHARGTSARQVDRALAIAAFLIRRVHFLIRLICPNLLTASASIRNDTELALI